MPNPINECELLNVLFEPLTTAWEHIDAQHKRDTGTLAPVPGPTCPQIDGVLSHIDEVKTRISYLQTHKNCQEQIILAYLEATVKLLENIKPHMEQLRLDNGNLRDIGYRWYNIAKGNHCSYQSAAIKVGAMLTKPKE